MFDSIIIMSVIWFSGICLNRNTFILSSVVWSKCVFDFHSSEVHPTKCLLEIMLSDDSFTITCRTLCVYRSNCYRAWKFIAFSKLFCNTQPKQFTYPRWNFALLWRSKLRRIDAATESDSIGSAFSLFIYDENK